MRFVLCAATLALSVPMAWSADAIDASSLKWSASEYAKIVDGRAIFDVPAGQTNVFACVTAPVDLEAVCGRDGYRASITMTGRGVSEPAVPWGGVKFMISYTGEPGGESVYPQAKAPRGTFAWTNIVFRHDFEGWRPTKAFVTIGLERASGRLGVDLKTLRIVRAKPAFPFVNPDGRAVYTKRVTEMPRLKGAMIAPEITPDSFNELADHGARLVRFTLNGANMKPEQRGDWKDPDFEKVRRQYFDWLDRRLAQFDGLVPVARKRGVKMIPALFNLTGGKHPGTDEDAMFRNPKWADLFIETWERIASRLKAHTDVIYGYDLVNEPLDRTGGPGDYYALQERCARRIRQIDPVTPIVMEPNRNASPSGFTYLTPFDLPDIIYTIHPYQPMRYTHQGLGKKAGEWEEVVYPSAGCDRAFLERNLAAARAFQLKYGARILVGEFSAAVWAKGSVDWLRDNISLFDAYGWDWCYHAWREFTGWNAEYEGVDFYHLNKVGASTPRMRMLIEAWRSDVAVVSAEAGENFRWTLNGTGRTERREVTRAAGSGTYSVRFRAALVNGKGGKFRVLADGVAFQSHGDGFYLDGSSVQRLVPGQADEINFDFTLRNRCYHDFVFVCTDDAVCLFGDGDEKRPVLRKPGAARGFSLVAENIDLDVLDFEVAEGDMRGTWTCRNQLINGGFETLNNGYPIAWGTYNFGFGSPKEIIDLENVRAHYRPDDTVAWEGRRSFYLASGCPLWECWRPRVAGVDYVFSAYVKGDCPGARVTMLAMAGYRAITQQVFSVGTSWTRLELPFRSLKGTLRVGFAKWHGNVWIDGVQLERGTKATAFVARPVPTAVVPPDPPKVMDHYYTDATKPRPPSGAQPRMACLNPRRNSFTFDGREFFLYGFSNPGFGDLKSYAAMMELYAKWGLNFISMGPNSFPKDPNVLRQYLDAAARNGIKVLIYISHQGEGKDLRLDPEQLAALKAVGAHPGICCVDILDEMCGRVTPEQRQRFADEIRAATEGKIPVQFNEFDLGVISHMDYSAADVASGDFYVPGQQEISAQYYVLKQLRDEHPDQVISYYPFASGHFTNTWLRDATPDEILAQAYIGYSLEVFNIKWWQGVPLTQPALDAVLQAKRERDLIDPSAFLDGEPVDVKCASRNDAVKFTARRMKNGVTRVIAVNIENRPNAAKWTLPFAPKTVKSLIGSGPDKVADAAIEDAFGPPERRVYDVCELK